jgi:hypothetical protein
MTGIDVFARIQKQRSSIWIDISDLNQSIDINGVQCLPFQFNMTPQHRNFDQCQGFLTSPVLTDKSSEARTCHRVVRACWEAFKIEVMQC